MLVSVTGCSGLYNQIDDLESQLAEEKAKNAELQKELEMVKPYVKQIKELEALVAELKATNEADAQTIEDLEEVISSMKSILSEENTQTALEKIATLKTKVEELESKVDELESNADVDAKTIEKLQETIEGLKENAEPNPTYKVEIKPILYVVDKSGNFKRLIDDLNIENFKEYYPDSIVDKDCEVSLAIPNKKYIVRNTNNIDYIQNEKSSKYESYYVEGYVDYSSKKDISSTSSAVILILKVSPADD